MSETKSQKAAHPEKAPFPDGSERGRKVTRFADGTIAVHAPEGSGWAEVGVFKGRFAEANARLDAAAPDMFEALKAAKAFHDRDSGLNGFTAEYEVVRAQIDAALSKATGGQHV